MCTLGPSCGSDEWLMQPRCGRPAGTADACARLPTCVAVHVAWKDRLFGLLVPPLSISPPPFIRFSFVALPPQVRGAWKDHVVGPLDGVRAELFNTYRRCAPSAANGQSMCRRQAPGMAPVLCLHFWAAHCQWMLCLVSVQTKSLLFVLCAATTLQAPHHCLSG